MPGPSTPAVLIQSVKGCSLAPVPVVSAVYRSAVRWALQLVDDVRVGVEAVLQGGIGTERAHDAAVAGALDGVAVGDKAIEQEGAAAAADVTPIADEVVAEV